MFSRMNGGLKAAFRARIDLFKNTLEKPIKSGKKVGGYQTKSLSLQSLQLMTNLATACQSLFTHHSHTHKSIFRKVDPKIPYTPLRCCFSLFGASRVMGALQQCSQLFCKLWSKLFHSSPDKIEQGIKSRFIVSSVSTFCLNLRSQIFCTSLLNSMEAESEIADISGISKIHQGYCDACTICNILSNICDI